MSFGFSVGDILMVAETANRLRKEFVGAPQQFAAVADEVRSLSIVLQDADVVVSEREVGDQQLAELDGILGGCRSVLLELQKVLGKYHGIDSRNGSLKSQAKRAWKKVSWEPAEIRDLRARITSNMALLNAFTGRISSEMIFETKKAVDQLNQRQADQDRRDILNWLTPMDYALQQNDFLNRRQEGTGQWLLDSQEYTTWLSEDRRTLFCPGIPGAGKTILTSVVVNDLITSFRTDPEIGLAYIYCNFQRQSEQKADQMLAALLRQLAEGQSPLPRTLTDLFEWHATRRTRPSVDEMLSNLRSIVSTYRKVYVLVDALDECQTSDGCRTRVLSELFDLQIDSNVNIFATSRFLPEITEVFNDLWLEIRASNGDVQRYLDSHLSQLPACVRKDSDLQAEVTSHIVSAVNGMFLLAQLHLESIRGKKSRKAIRVALKNLATGSNAYDCAYDDTMKRIESQLGDEVELAKQALSWITCAKAPLTTAELRHALAVEAGEDELDEDNLSQIEDIVSVCAGLVTVDEESDIIRLVHYTTQEYLERMRDRWFPGAEADITTVCVTYMSFGTFRSGPCHTDKEFEKRLQSYRLYSYATRNWGYHARDAPTLVEEILDFVEDKTLVEAASQAMMVEKKSQVHLGYSQDLLKGLEGRHLAAHFGIESLIRRLFQGHESGEPGVIDALSDTGTPLSCAAACGNETVARLLIEKGASVDVLDKYGRTPLSLAASGGHEGMVRFLLEKGADVRLRRKPGWAPLNHAAGNGYERILRLLCEKGGDIDLKDAFDRTPLSYAAENGLEDIVRLLLEKEAQIDVEDEDGRTPFNYAATCGHEDIVKILLEKGAELDKKDHRRTPLSRASERGQQGIVRLLLEKGADCNAKGRNNNRTPISWAAERGHEGVVRLLLEKGAEIDLEDVGERPLHMAAMRGHEEVVRLLLQEGTDSFSKDEDGWTPLAWAAKGGYEGITRLLIETGAKNPKDNHGRTPLSWAAENGHGEIVRLLLKNGAQFESGDDLGSGK